MQRARERERDGEREGEEEERRGGEEKRGEEIRRVLIYVILIQYKVYSLMFTPSPFVYCIPSYSIILYSIIFYYITLYHTMKVSSALARSKRYWENYFP
jgi:hypothetical protein